MAYTLNFNSNYDYCGAKNRTGIHSVDGISENMENTGKARFQKGFLKVNSSTVEVYIMLNDCLFRTLVPLERILERAVIKAPRKTSKIRAYELTASAPFSRKQIELLIEENAIQPIATRFEVLQENKSNNGKNIEYTVSKFYHKKFDHQKTWADGGEFNGRQVKYFDMDTSNGRHVTLCGFTSDMFVLI